MQPQWKDTLIRVARTFFQTAIGVFMAGLLANDVTGLGAFGDVTLLNAAAAAGVVSVLTFVQNWLETTASVTYSRG